LDVDLLDVDFLGSWFLIHLVSTTTGRSFATVVGLDANGTGAGETTDMSSDVYHCVNSVCFVVVDLWQEKKILMFWKCSFPRNFFSIDE